ncbi:MAG: ABC transporter permease [Dehalococcoidia bacterium]|nr:ABC transporter permease [Dehalococcoidia bacterium]
MDSLFGVALTDILIALLLMVGMIFGVLGFIAWRNPLLVRMGIRNIARRKAQTALIVVGLMLSTLIISAAFATGDTVGYSVTNTVYNDFGAADLVAGFDQDSEFASGRDGLLQGDLEAIRAAFAGDPNMDGVTGFIQTPVPALNPDQRLSEPSAQFVGTDAASVDGLGQILTPEGQALLMADLGEDEVYVSVRLANDLLLEAGSPVRIFYDNQPYDFTVAAVVQDNALTAATALTSGAPAGGVVAPLERVRAIIGEPERIDLIVVSATGGIRDTLHLNEDIKGRFEAAVEEQSLPAEAFITKAEAVEIAEIIGSVFVTFFLVFGLFSMAAGIMLIFLTFVMLAAERRSEMGMARAVGMKRLHLTQAFIAEGMSYNLGSAFVGALLGLGVAYLLITVMGGVVEDFGLGITFHVNPTGFLISYFLGVVITFATVAIASWRAANLNIVRAIRDIPEPEPLRGKDASLSGLVKATVGAAWYILWMLVVVLAGLLIFYAFIFSLTAYGLPLLGAGLVIAAFVWGLRTVNMRNRSRLRLLGLVAWWVVFNVIALLGFFLLRTKRWADTHRTSGGWAVLMLIVGLLATWWGGWIGSQAFAYTGGTTLILLAVAMLAVYFGAPARPVFATISALTVWYWLLPLPFSLFFEEGKTWTDPLDGLFGLVGLGHETVEGNIEMFFVSGVCITAASTLFVIFNADRLLGGMGLLRKVLGGITPAVRTAIAYPLAAKFRTGMTLAMFTLVVFSLVVMATLNHNFTQLFLGEGARGGFDVQVTANPNNPIGDLRTALQDRGYDVDANIAAIGHIVTGAASMKPAAEDDDFFSYRLTGLAPSFLDVADFPMTTVAEGYADDAAVIEALRTDPDVAVANEMVLDFVQRQNFMNPDDVFSIQGNIREMQEAPWQPIAVQVRDDETGEERTVNIIAFVDSAIVSGIVPQWIGIFVPEATALDLMDNPAEVFFLNTAGGDAAFAIEVANSVESTLLERGVQANSLRQLIADSTAQSNAFANLFVAFMSLGLIVGIAALGVIAFRTVAERRQQIGMLRAIGYSRRLVAVSFFLESSFIAVTGIGMGLILGAALSYNLMTSPEFTNGADIDFSFPIATILIVVGIAYVATALMTLIPARSASRVQVAEALRYSA